MKSKTLAKCVAACWAKSFAMKRNAHLCCPAVVESNNPVFVADKLSAVVSFYFISNDGMLLRERDLLTKNYGKKPVVL